MNPKPQEGQKLILVSILLELITYVTETAHANPHTEGLLPLFPYLENPETLEGRTLLTVFITAKISSLLFLNLGIYSLSNAFCLPTWTKIFLLVLALSSILNPYLFIPTLLCAAVLTLKNIHPKSLL